MAERSSSRQPGSPTDPLSNISAFRRAPAIGSMLGKYQITGKLGQGGMGIVYQGLDTVLHRKVAIKVLPDSVGGDDNALQRFLREARTAARLTHPNVVAVFDVNQQDGLHYLVMELVTGRSLSAQLEEQGPLDWREATRVIADACRGLSAAHAASLIHRDIKPGNLLRSGDGLVKLADFGLAKATDRTALTQSGSVLGTPLFMSPEQCKSQPLDQRSDIYSLGATYYMLLTGEPPYRADGSIEVMFAHCHNPVPDPRQHKPDLPAACAAIVKKAMAKEPGQRFQSAAEILAALEAAAAGQYLADTSVQMAPAATTDRRRRLVLVGLLLGLGGLGLIGLISYLTHSAGQPTRSQAQPSPSGTAAKTGSAAGKHALMVLAPAGFHNPDYLPVRRVLEEGGVKVTVASTRSPAMPDKMGGGQNVVPDVFLNAVRASEGSRSLSAARRRPSKRAL